MIQILFLLICIFAIIYIFNETNECEKIIKKMESIIEEPISNNISINIEPMISKNNILYKNNKNKNKLHNHKGKK
jgi:hypothetical protein